jgi:threonylcarbamoyladenosine tRNA methylthiotransferase MtaB
VVGNAAKQDLPAAIERRLRDGRRPGDPPERARVVWSADPTIGRFLECAGPVPRRRTRALLKVQDGCPYACSYCIVSRLRGRPRSRPAADVLAEARRLVAAGFREIVVTGVNLGLYGREREAAGGLAALLRRLAPVVGPGRLRLSSLEPMTIDSELLETLAELRPICRSLHIPIQAGDDGLLRRMGRPYDRRAIRDLISRIGRVWGEIGLGVDLIAGFPGESPAAFGRTLELVESLPVTYLHAFGYSARPGTPAAALPGAVPSEVRKERVHALRALDERLRRRFRRRLAGRRCQVLVESSAAGRFAGLSSEYVRLRGAARDLPVGALVDVIAAEEPAEDPLGCRLVRS